MKATLFIAAVSLVSFAAAAATPEVGNLYGNAARGQEIVARWCAGCHATGPAVDDRIPSLPALANNRSRSEGAIRAFLMQPHKPMPPLEISTQQIEDIIVFLRSVQPAPK